MLAGVETLTVVDAEPGEPLTLLDAEGKPLITELADDLGQAHFAYVPDEYLVVQTGPGAKLPTTEGRTLDPGRYRVRSERTGAVTAEVEVMSREDHPDGSFYDGRDLTKDCPDFERERRCYTYIEVRDGTLLSAHIWLPDKTLWGDPPYPTVVQYSGYSPSKPSERPGEAGLLANLLGYAVVGVNMRGTGCSGGVFDIFNPAQHTDGYDVIETVARQPWVLHNKVGMVGLSYPGISQLYVASTKPPSLAAIAPQSVIDDPWRQQWPGGIYNDGFTKQWLAERDRQNAVGGSNWTTERIEQGDEVCERNQRLRNQNLEFEEFARALEFYPPDADARRLELLVRDIEVPVFLTGAWQDEQTGSRFAYMLDDFVNAPVRRFTLFNGHHPDGLSPLVATRWWEFLELYVARRRPTMPEIVRAAAPAAFEQEFGARLGFEPDRFAGLDSYEEVKKAYEAEPEVRILFESGAGSRPGWHVARYEATFDRWPPPDVEKWTRYLTADGSLSEDAAGSEAELVFEHDLLEGGRTTTAANAYDFIKPVVQFDWKQSEEGKTLSFLTEPFGEDVVLAAPGYVELRIAPGAADANVEVNLSEVTADGTEFRVQSGWLRLGHYEGVDRKLSDEFRVEYTFRREDFTDLEPGEEIVVKVPIYPFVHGFRKGSRLRLTIDTPGGNTPLWTFRNPSYAGVRHVVKVGGVKPSNIVLMRLGRIDVPDEPPPCPSLRGQICRPYVAVANRTAD
ncbi:MAG: hypothetical protein KatS3mg008_0478 [Acidimicrobiales bacterium]|nr:MAG: hypothetical protein KatS3mg008_0478 [Acidimicrobiales bacterium]